MVDKYPNVNNTSTIKTNPTLKTTAAYRKQPLSQLGLATSYSSNGSKFTFTRKPTYQQLAAWDGARRTEPIIKQALEYIVLAVTGKIGAYSHPDPKIDSFIQANVSHKLSRWIGDILMTSLWAGFGVSEIVYKKQSGPKDVPQIWIDEVINYHPLQVSLELNDFNVVKDGDEISNVNHKSGVYVPAPVNYTARHKNKNVEMMGNFVRLPKHKRLYITLNSEGNNPFGRSTLESVLPYHLFKEAFRDMLTTALDRYGTPLVYAIVPPLDTREMVEDVDGNVRPKTLQELTVETMQDLSGESALVFTQISKDQPVQLGALTTGNNFSDAFTQAIDLCDLNMLHGLGIPNLLILDTTTRMGGGGASERQLELFDAFISSIFDRVLNAFLDQVILPLIQINFDVKSNDKAYLSGSIQKKPTRVTELATVINSIETLTRFGYMNPANELDFKFARELINAPERMPDPLPDGILPTNRDSSISTTTSIQVPNPATDYAIEANKKRVNVNEQPTPTPVVAEKTTKKKKIN